MPVMTKLIDGKLRTVDAETGTIADTEKGNPRDGGGWDPDPVGKATAARQAGHINKSIAKDSLRPTELRPPFSKPRSPASIDPDSQMQTPM